MIKHTWFLLFGLLPFSLRAQYNSYANVIFQGNTFRVFDVKVTDQTLSRFELVNNASNLVHYEFLRAEALNSYSASMWITSTTYDDKCNPLGFYTISGRPVNNVNTATTGSGNFFMQPNGALLLTKSDAQIVETPQINSVTGLVNGLQSGPMLVSGGQMNAQFQKKSVNVNMRSGVGLYTDPAGVKHLVFVVSKHPVNFFNLANLFKSKFGCNQALALTSANCAISLPYETGEIFPNANKVCCGYIRFRTK